MLFYIYDVIEKNISYKQIIITKNWHSSSSLWNNSICSWNCINFNSARKEISMVRIYIRQCRVIAMKKPFRIMLAFLCFIVTANYLYNVHKYYGTEICNMYSFLEISVLGTNTEIFFYIGKFFPLMVVLPVAMGVAGEQLNSIDILWINRCGIRKYYISKIIAVFFMTFIVFFLPLMLELLLNCISFPSQAHGNLYGRGLYSENYKTIERYLFFRFYYNYPFIYGVLMSIVFSGVAASLSVFTSAVACIYYKYKAYLLIPVYLLIYLLDILGAWGKDTNGHNIMMISVLSWCQSGIQKQHVLNVSYVCAALCLVSVIIYLGRIKKDVL